MLDEAESLIKTQKSKYPMDKYSGLRDLYFLRGFFYSVLAGGAPEYLNEAIADFDRCLELDPNYKKAINLKEKSQQEQSYKRNSKKSGGGCFIATAVMGTSLADEVVMLSNFRDEVLFNYSIGRLFIKTYYTISPSIAKIIYKSRFFKYMTRLLIINPSIWLIMFSKRGE